MLAKTHSAANNSQKINGYTAVLNYKVKIHSECRTFFFLWINLTMVNNFLLMLLSHIKEAENDQQGQTGNGDEHANVEEGKNWVLLSIVTYEITSPRLCRVLCAILFFPFSFLYLIPFFHFLPCRRANWNAGIGTQRNPRSGSPWIACTAARSFNKYRSFDANDKAVIDFAIQLSWRACIF